MDHLENGSTTNCLTESTQPQSCLNACCQLLTILFDEREPSLIFHMTLASYLDDITIYTLSCSAVPRFLWKIEMNHLCLILPNHCVRECRVLKILYKPMRRIRDNRSP